MMSLATVPMMDVLWQDRDSSGYTDHIPVDWLTSGPGPLGVVHYTTGPRSRRQEAKCDVAVTDQTADLNYEPYPKFNLAQKNRLGILRIEFTSAIAEIDFTSAKGDVVRQVFWKKRREKTFDPYPAKISFSTGQQHFDALVAASLRLTPAERQRRLANANKTPQQARVMTTVFQRNPHVVAEVLFRAAGICEECGKPAPFKRAHSGEPYLEVHHLVRLADGGDDTVENALALCPNCHRRAHYG